MLVSNINGSLNWREFVLKEKPHQCHQFVKALFVSHPLLSSHALVIGIWHRDDIDALFYSCLPKRWPSPNSLWLRPWNRTPSCSLFLWNQACPDQKRDTLLWITTAALNCRFSGPTGMAPLPVSLPEPTNSLLTGILFTSIFPPHM